MYYTCVTKYILILIFTTRIIMIPLHFPLTLHTNPTDLLNVLSKPKGLVVKSMQGASDGEIADMLATPCKGAMKHGNW